MLQYTGVYVAWVIAAVMYVRLSSCTVSGRCAAVSRLDRGRRTERRSPRVGRGAAALSWLVAVAHPEGMRYKVVHAPFVVVRSSPSTAARVIGQRALGATFHATLPTRGWVRITGGPNLGWVLADGREAEESDAVARRFGRLLLPLPTGGAHLAANNLVLGVPTELLPTVLSCASVSEIMALRATCRALRLATSSSHLWLDLA